MTLKSISTLIDRHKTIDNLRKAVNNSPTSNLKLEVNLGLSNRLTKIQTARDFIRTDAELKYGLMLFDMYWFYNDNMLEW